MVYLGLPIKDGWIFYSYVTNCQRVPLFRTIFLSEATGDAALLPRAQAATGHLHIVGRVEPLSDSKLSGHVVPRCHVGCWISPRNGI